jgi:hypothetical protein
MLLAFQNCPAEHQKSKIDREQLDTKLHRFISEPPVAMAHKEDDHIYFDGAASF